jgi:hypothetical protein
LRQRQPSRSSWGRLVAHDDGDEARFVQAPHRGGGGGDQVQVRQLLGPAALFVYLVQHAVAIEEDRSGRHQRALLPRSAAVDR